MSQTPHIETPHIDKPDEGFKYLKLASRDEAVDVAVQIVAAELDLAVQKFGRASCLLSGGSSPRPIYERLSREPIAWEGVTIGLVDERWVKEGEAGSNASFLKQTILQNEASAANFIPMTTPHASAREGAAELNMRYRQIGLPFDVVMMGMGTDGHTASWFPNSEGLAPALDVKEPSLIGVINAKDCPGAGDFPQRVTLTLPSIINARCVILFITGEQKRRVFDASAHKDVMDAPVKALRALSSRLTVIWSP